MPDIDLIPADYRDRLGKTALMRNYLVAFVVLNLIVLGGGFALQRSTGHAETRIAELKVASAITQQQQQQLEELKTQESEYERRWSLLRGLRAGAAVDEIFSLIDDSLIDDELWFLDWSFRRAGVIVDGQKRGVETGYFIIVSEDDDPLAEPNLGVETHMTIHGQARDHQALSCFVRALFEQSDVKDVNVQKTAQTDYANGRAVEFDLTIVLNSSWRDS